MVSNGLISRSFLAKVASAFGIAVMLLAAPAGFAASDAAAAEAGVNKQSQRSMVRKVQERLRDMGYDPGPADGIMGAKTRNSLVSYQMHHGLPVDGTLNGPTLRSLGIVK